MAVLLETTLGNIVIDLFVKERPKCSYNFLKLCKLKYYNLCNFHTIENNYIAQTGDPSGSGRGGESIYKFVSKEKTRYFPMEIFPKMRHTRRGLVSMVNNGDGLLGSQFFFTLADDLDYLNEKHTIFGQITEGWETLDALNNQICDELNQPYLDIRIAHVLVLDDPFDDPEDFRYSSRSPSPTLDLLKSMKIAPDQKIDENEGKDDEEVRVELEKKDMTANAQILEMIGDLRYAEEKPPDNVLFVCKLNPVTNDESLKTIFSRFGKITSCEVIRDRRTDASLQYAFIEFEEVSNCENAYFKMDNVLIDDRRIHVDFSQSVAKNYKWKRKNEKTESKVDSEESHEQSGKRMKRKHNISDDDIDSSKNFGLHSKMRIGNEKKHKEMSSKYRTKHEHGRHHEKSSNRYRSRRSESKSPRDERTSNHQYIQRRSSGHNKRSKKSRPRSYERHSRR